MHRATLAIVALVALSSLAIQTETANTGMAQNFRQVLKEFDQTPEFNCLYYNILRAIMHDQDPYTQKYKEAKKVYESSVEQRSLYGYPSPILINDQWKDVAVNKFWLAYIDWDRPKYCTIAAKKCAGDWNKQAMQLSLDCQQWFSHFRERLPRCCEPEPPLEDAPYQEPRLGTIKGWSDWYEQ